MNLAHLVVLGLALGLSAPAIAEPSLRSSQQAFLADTQSPEPLAPLAATPCVGGLAGTYPCNNVDLMAFLPLSSIGGGSGNDIWGWTSPGGREFAIMGRTSGTAFVEITDPANPVYLGNLPTQTFNSSWRDVKTYANHAFIVSEASNHGMQVFDLAKLLSVAVPPVTFAADANYTGFGSAHNIAINEDTGFAYAVGTTTCSAGLHMINIQDPKNPTNAGCVGSDGYTHDTQCVIYHGPDISHVGKEICFSSNEDTVTIVNVTDKNAPVQLSRTGYAGVGYTHQGWLTEDHSYFLLGDELDEENLGHNTRTRIFDVRDLDAPTLVGFFDNTTAAIDHNLYVKGGLVFEANYRAGLRILDLANVASGSLTEVGFFDVYPSSNTANFNGAWSVYPYFASGIVIVSGIEQGLFVLRPTGQEPDFRLRPAASAFNVCQSGIGATTVSVDALNDYTGEVTLSATGLPPGATANFIPPTVIAPNTSSMTIDVLGATPGSHPFTLEGGDGVKIRTSSMSLDVSVPLVAAPVLLLPQEGLSFVDASPALSWSGPVPADATVEISTDPTFAALVYSAGTTSQNHAVSAPLASATTYYWRVRTANDCGPGPTSATSSFNTGTVATSSDCRTLSLAIPDNLPAGVTDSVVLTRTGAILDLNVSIKASHTWVGDLLFELDRVETPAKFSPLHESPVKLIDRPGVPASTYGCSNNNIDILLDSQTVDPVESQCGSDPALFGTRAPNDSLLVYNGESLAATWTLRAADNVSGDTGTLLEWCLNATTGSPVPAGRIGVIGQALTLEKDPSPSVADLQLSWGPSCSAGAIDFAIYEGAIGDWTNLSSVACSTAALQTYTLTPGSGDRWFVVVAQTPTEEGSYGRTSTGAERARAATPCRSQAATVHCP